MAKSDSKADHQKLIEAHLTIVFAHWQSGNIGGISINLSLRPIRIVIFNGLRAEPEKDVKSILGFQVTNLSKSGDSFLEIFNHN
jgi:hypothetical protein